MAQQQKFATLADLLLSQGIRPKNFLPGQHPHLWCPSCQGGKTLKDRDLSVHIDEDGRGATWLCQRASCDFKGGARLDGAARLDGVDRPAAPPPKPRAKPRPHSPAVES